jgi:SNF2 family DNA or RNA helicase
MFRHDPEVQVLLATDAAGEGINLQRAHLMVNYDLPWNPNRLEQRFGRIHRIGQTEVCHLWNLVAEETREGDVYRKLLEKLEQARLALGGQVFDVLGKLQPITIKTSGNKDNNLLLFLSASQKYPNEMNC